MKSSNFPKWAVAVSICFLAVSALPASDDNTKVPRGGSAPQAPFVVLGQTRCIPSRKAIISPTIARKVTEILVSQGDEVKKGQPLINLDDATARADVRLKKVILENAEMEAREAKRYLAGLEKLYSQGAIPEQRLHEFRSLGLKLARDRWAAKARLDWALLELEHHVVTARLDGAVNRLRVNPGMVSEPGSVWGEILDLKQLEVRVHLTRDQTNLVEIGTEGEVLNADGTNSYGKGRLVFIGLEANADDGKVPGLVRLANP